MAITKWSTSHFKNSKRREILQFKWFIPIEWSISNVDFTQFITIHYQTFASQSNLIIQGKTHLSNDDSLQFIQSINLKSIHFLKTTILNLNSLNHFQTINIKYTQIISITIFKSFDYPFICSVYPFSSSNQFSILIQFFSSSSFNPFFHSPI